MDNSACSVIIVTHNSERYIHETMECLARQTVPSHHIVIVDCLSKDPSYLKPYQGLGHITVHLSDKNLGFCEGNNLGLSLVPKSSDYVLFLNPDAFLTPEFLKRALTHMNATENHMCGMLSGTLLRYDIQEKRLTGTYDSTGIFSTWYGKWYDRDQGCKVDAQKYVKVEKVPALCGALLFCRKGALDQVKLSNGDLFDRAFYMYKEDIDLSCRMRKAGWVLHFCPDFIAYHCRGWQERSHVSKRFRLMAARNEVRLHWRLRAPIKLSYSLLKWSAVQCLDM